MKRLILVDKTSFRDEEGSSEALGSTDGETAGMSEQEKHGRAFVDALKPGPRVIGTAARARRNEERAARLEAVGRLLEGFETRDLLEYLATSRLYGELGDHQIVLEYSDGHLRQIRRFVKR